MFTNEELIDKIISLLNDIADENGIVKCAHIFEAYQMLKSLKEGLEKIEVAHKAEKELLLKQLDDLNLQMLGDIPEGGMVTGGQKYSVDLMTGEVTNQNGRESEQ